MATERQNSLIYKVILYTFIWASPCVNVSFGIANSEGPDQPARASSLIRAFSVANRIIEYYSIFQPRANARMRLCADVG